jgi:hypothetical protein
LTDRHRRSQEAELLAFFLHPQVEQLFSGQLRPGDR